jgi:hypothetical protein
LSAEKNTGLQPRKGLEGRADPKGLRVLCAARRKEWSEAEPRKARFPAACGRKCAQIFKKIFIL